MYIITMLTLPDKIKITLEELRKEYKFFVSLKKINNKYYLYKQTTVWNKEKKKLKVLSTYLGRITGDGAYIKKEITHQDELENAKAVIIANGGKVILPKIEDGEIIQVKELTPDEVDRRILMTLSMNSRASLAFLGKQIGLTVSATYNKVKHLEKKYGIKYITELNVEKLGYSEFLVMVRFLEGIPTSEELKMVFLKEKLIQLALTTKGEYDVVLYVLAKNEEELKFMLSRVRGGELAKYKSMWNCAPIFKSFGCVPLRDEFVEILKEDLLDREYAVIKELNSDSKKDFTEIDKVYNFDRGRSQYSYHKIIERKILERATISLQKIPIKYIGIIFIVEVDSKAYEQNRDKLLTHIMEGISAPFDKFIYRANTVAPDGSVCFMPVGEDGQLEEEAESYKKLNLGVNVTTTVSTGIIVGTVCIRVSDPAYSLQHAALVRDYKSKAMPKVDYFETGRNKTNDQGA